MIDPIISLGYDPADLTVKDKMAERIIRLRRWVIALTIVAIIGALAATVALMRQPGRYALQVSGSMGWRMDTQTGNLEGFTWDTGPIN